MVYIDIPSGREVDIDSRENITSIQNISSDEECFYIICNIRDGKQGLYLFSLEQKNIDSEAFYYIAQ